LGKKVYIVGPGESEARIFKERGYDVVSKLNKSDIVVFTGGQDISPHIYGQYKLSVTGGVSHKRDEYEIQEHGKITNQFRVGICRGGQLLCALNGENLIQHVNNHAGRKHEATFYLKDGPVIVEINSVHHQAFDARNIADKVMILGTAAESTLRVTPEGEFHSDAFLDQEALYFPRTRSFCFQAHPEYGHQGTNDVFFQLLEECMSIHDPAYQEKAAKKAADKLAKEIKAQGV